MSLFCRPHENSILAWLYFLLQLTYLSHLLKYFLLSQINYRIRYQCSGFSNFLSYFIEFKYFVSSVVAKSEVMSIISEVCVFIINFKVVMVVISVIAIIMAIIGFMEVVIIVKYHIGKIHWMESSSTIVEVDICY